MRSASLVQSYGAPSVVQTSGSFDSTLSNDRSYSSAAHSHTVYAYDDRNLEAQMTGDERDWHERMVHRLRGDIVNLSVAAQAFDRYGEVGLASGARILIQDLQARALMHEELTARGDETQTQDLGYSTTYERLID